MSELVTLGRGRSREYYQASSTLLDEIRGRTWDALRPMFAHVYVENRCHLKCEHCYESEETHPGHAGMSLEEYEALFDELAQLGVLVLTFSGGEPFLRKDFLDIVAAARRRRFAVRIYTSGTPITPEKADRLAELKVSEVHISVYSHEAERHDAFTGQKGSWTRSVQALELLQERGIKTVLKANVLSFNVDHLDELVALAQRVGADHALDPTVKPRMNNDATPLQFAVPAAELAQKFYARPELSPPPTFDDVIAMCSGENRRDHGGPLCQAGRGLLAVWADGQIAPCAMFPVAGGNVREQKLQDIWLRSPLFDEVRRTQMKDMTSCGSCSVRGGCTPCMAYGIVEHGDHRACNSSSLQAAAGRKKVAEALRQGLPAEKAEAPGTGGVTVGA